MRGMCGKHYQRWKKHGDPTKTTNVPRDYSNEQRLRWHGWVEVLNVADLGVCWEWKGSLDGWGYGALRTLEGRQEAAHRVAYRVWVGPIPEDKILLHSCDVPKCINPAHLRLGTDAENARDRDSRGRSGSAKMTADQVLEIRRLRRETRLTIDDIAEMFGMSRDGIAAIIYRKVWKNV